MPAKLLYRDAQGHDAAVDIPGDGNPLFLGRGMDCPIRTDDAMVSRKNTKIYASGDRFYAEDLGSSNGSFMRLREETEIKSGDVLLMGQQLFRVAV